MMNQNLNNFRSWYVNILNELYSKEDAGFTILMISFPLLERYLREKSGVHEGNLNDSFHNELQTVFPALTTLETAKQFWHVYRNGLLHQVTLSMKDRKGIQMPTSWLHKEVDILKIDNSGDFWVHPVKFAKKVIEVIENDFTTFEGQHSANHPLPRIHPITLGTSTMDFQ